MSKPKDRKNIHHRKPQSIGGLDVEANRSEVCVITHQHWHGCFSNKTAQEIVADLNNIWLDPDYKVVLLPQFPSMTKP